MPGDNGLLGWLRGLFGADGPPEVSNIPPAVGHKIQALDGDPLPLRTLASMKGDQRWILSIDGGGVRGILALLAIQKFQQLFEPNSDGSPRALTEIFDLVAGTSTGAIIAALLAKGKPIQEVIDQYSDTKWRQTVFTPNKDFQESKFGAQGALDKGLAFVNNVGKALGAAAILIGALSAVAIIASAGSLTPAAFTLGLILAGLLVAIPTISGFLESMAQTELAHSVITPWYKKNIRDILNAEFGDTTLSSQTTPAGTQLKTDILITARDAFRNATMYLTAFDPSRIPQSASLPNLNRSDPDFYDTRGSFRNMRLRDAVEASMSAPLFFAPHDRFLDGGVGAFNNPAAAAALEALMFSAPAEVDPAKNVLTYADNQQLYAKGKVTVWSFGTGSLVSAFSGSQLRDKHDFQFWVQNTISQTFQDANDQQHWIARDLLDRELHWIKYHRYQLYVGPDMVNKLGLTADEIAALTGPGHEDFLENLMQMDAIDDARFSWLLRFGQLFADHLATNYQDHLNFDGEPIVEFGKPSPTDMEQYVRLDVLPSVNAIAVNDLRSRGEQ